MTVTLPEHVTVADVVIAYPCASRVFEQHHIDYCCWGHRALRTACRLAHLNEDELFGELERALEEEDRAGVRAKNWAEMSLTEITRVIVEKHHAFLRSELLRLIPLFEKVAAVHCEKGPEIYASKEIFAEMGKELEEHMFKEEKILFPMIAVMEAANARGLPRPAIHCGTLFNPIVVMKDDHRIVAERIKDLTSVIGPYSEARDACPSIRALSEGLRNLEAELHEHIHLENNILFPRAMELEASFRCENL